MMVTSLARTRADRTQAEPAARPAMPNREADWLSLVVVARGGPDTPAGVLAAVAELGSPPLVLRETSLRDALPALVRAHLVVAELAARDRERLDELGECRERIPAPIVAVVVGGKSSDRADVLEAGAAGCVSWPCDPRELTALCRAVLRLTGPAEPTAESTLVLQGDGIEIDLDRRYVVNAGRVYALSPTEVGILRLLVAVPSQIVPYGRVLQEVWGEAGVDNHLLREAVRRLRKKVESDPGRPRHLLTSPWVGLRFEL